jgi:hypothetical protein
MYTLILKNTDQISAQIDKMINDGIYKKYYLDLYYHAKQMVI